MNEELATLIGLLLSDGSVYYDKSKRTYCIQFTNKNPELLDFFKKLMKNCFNFTHFSVNRAENALSVRAFSAKVARILMNYSPSFRTQACEHFPKCSDKKCAQTHPYFDGTRYPPCRIPEEILSDKNLTIAFLRGYVSGDGNLYVNPKHSIVRVEITCYHPFLRNQLSDCFRMLSFRPRISGKRVIVSNIKDCRRFLKEINFIPEKSLTLF